MCGIFGWSLKAPRGKPSRSQQTLSAALAYQNDGRGGHSWGYWADGEVRKGLGTFARAGDDDLGRLGRARLAMGHTRYATTGDRTLDNAHPFEIGGIIGAHNGIVYNHATLNELYGRTCAVDSMHLFHHIAEGLDTSGIQAYGAIQWVDSEEPDTIYLASFNGGDLAAAKTRTGIVWSSDWMHLRDALECAGIGARWFEMNEGTVYSAGCGELYEVGSITVGAPKWRGRPIRWDDALKADHPVGEHGETWDEIEWECDDSHWRYANF